MRPTLPFREDGAPTVLTADAAKADVAGGAFRRVVGAGGDAIAIAIRPVAKIRATFNYLRLSVRWPRRVRASCQYVKCWMEPVGAPLPCVSSYGVKVKGIWRKRVYRRETGISVFGSIVVWKFALPNVAKVFAAGCEFVSPGIQSLLQAAAGRKFPLGFRW